MSDWFSEHGSGLMLFGIWVVFAAFTTMEGETMFWGFFAGSFVTFFLTALANPKGK